MNFIRSRRVGVYLIAAEAIDLVASAALLCHQLNDLITRLFIGRRRLVD